MASDKHLGHCIPFAFQLKENFTEATEMISSAFGEGAVTQDMQEVVSKISEWGFRSL